MASDTLAEAPTRADPFLSRLGGAWTGEGTAFGSASKIQAEWDWVLAGNFFRLRLQYAAGAADGAAPDFAGHAYYKVVEPGAYEGHWFDSMGNQYPITAKLEGESLTANWGIPGKTEGRSIYRLEDAGKGFAIIDAVKQKDGSWQDFSRFKLQRK